jgi:hypothetical protein
MYGLCEGMKWAHLPVAGGIYDQDPKLMAAFRYIMGEKSAHEAREDKKRQRKADPKNAGSLGRSARIM